ncbi:MAG: HAD-IIA family hydrolase [Firmicutes bacterium]|nr:HAD-IIA family hydrolase [Bacillota bacterium]
MTTFRGYILDLDGTVYRGDKLIPGADKVVATLRKMGKKVVFLSNKPTETRADYATKLMQLGVPADEDDVVNSSFAMAQYLAARSPGCRAYVIGEPPLVDELRRAGVTVVDNPTGPEAPVDYVIIAFDRTFDYAKLNNALQAVRLGARLLATNADRTCPVEGGEIPDAAAMIGAVEGATGAKVELVIGKPNPIMLELACKRMGVCPHECLIVGDRLETDMLMGKRAGMMTALVLTGVTSGDQVEALSFRPDYVLDSIGDLLR